MVRGCEQDGAFLGQAPGEAHNQMGMVESHGLLFSNMLPRVTHETTPLNREQWEECVDIVADTKSQMMRAGGTSPEQIGASQRTFFHPKDN